MGQGWRPRNGSVDHGAAASHTGAEDAVPLKPQAALQSWVNAASASDPQPDAPVQPSGQLANNIADTLGPPSQTQVTFDVPDASGGRATHSTCVPLPTGAGPTRTA